MASPIEFLRTFRSELHAAGIRFAITPGQACVYYGIQQTTKDSVWILPPDDMSAFRALMSEAEADGRFRASYRSVCGAPLDTAWHRNGWTSHLVVTDTDGAEHHINLFGSAPRVSNCEPDPVEPDYASRHVVAQMKNAIEKKTGQLSRHAAVSLPAQVMSAPRCMDWSRTGASLCGVACQIHAGSHVANSDHC